jgi:cytochrome c551/c552
VNRLLPLACTLWLACLLAATPHAGETPQSRIADAHQALSLFSHSDNCVACHNSLIAPTGEDVSIGSTWRSTMMANSARDPYWQAGVRREVMDHPTRSADIQNECSACHMPMAQKIAHATGGRGEVFRHLPIAQRQSSTLQRLASDGISCTVCHQIAPDTLGTRESFNANFVIRPTGADGARVIFGPFQVESGRQSIMRSATGFVQSEAPHIRQSEVCATCHTLITEAFGPNGEVIGSLPEQMNYQEWEHSAFKDEQRSCQSCHMPPVEGPVRAASVLGEARERLARHVFVGGNAFMVRMLSRYRTELGVEALPSELEATARATTLQLQRETATVAVSTPEIHGNTLTFDVDVRNLTGHKFPTGYPSRRTWLHVTVRDRDDAVVFESGAVERSGAIAGNDNDTDPRLYEPHYVTINRADQVQIYEPILGDSKGAPTTGLLQATQYLKDNRLLPRGFNKATASPEIAVYGGAAADADFTASGDRVHYAIDIPRAGPYRIDVEVRYQTIAYRWAHNLAGYDAAEPGRFLTYYRSMSSSSSTVVAGAVAEVRPDLPPQR